MTQRSQTERSLAACRSRPYRSGQASQRRQAAVTMSPGADARTGAGGLEDVRQESSSETSAATKVAYLELPALPTAPFWARWQTRIVLDWWEIHPETAQTAVLVVSEMVTNATKACGLPTSMPRYSEVARAETIALTLKYLRHDIRVEVADPDTNPPMLSKADPDAEDGRGLMLIDELCHEWSYFYLPAGGKIVYALLDVTTGATDE
jgi:Histidine kinase-like ATPase domain